MRRLTIFLLLFNVFALRAQDNMKLKSLWVDLGVGGYLPQLLEDHKGISYAILIQYRLNKHMISLRFLNNHERFISECNFGNISEKSLLYGQSIKWNKNSNVTPFIGISKVQKVESRKITDSMDSYSCSGEFLSTAVGLPLGLKFMVNNRICVYSLNIFGNINKFQTYFGFLLCFGLGSLY